MHFAHLNAVSSCRQFEFRFIYLQLHMNHIRSTKAFTLIEVVLVIAILAVLAAVSVPKFINLSVQAKMAAMYGVTGAVNSGLVLYRAANPYSDFPDQLDEAFPLLPASDNNPIFTEVLDHGGITDDFWSKRLNRRYRCSVADSNYTWRYDNDIGVLTMQGTSQVISPPSWWPSWLPWPF